MTGSPALPTLLFYRRDGCHLCDDAREALQAVLEERAAQGSRIPRVREVDIDRDEEAQRRYMEAIPVLALDGAELRLATGYRSIHRFLQRSLDAGLA
ncbi:MAG: glutaredoxin family protein [Chloroflexi bacterium]|nr:glutaredoxin family protein [Chloroflexota bacterium]